MRRKRVLAVYLFATVGGVERVLLNRAVALSRIDAPVAIDAHFFTDHGGCAALRAAIAYYKLERYLRVVERPRLADYDTFMIIDTPEMFEFVPASAKLVIECHASRFVAQQYLHRLPERDYTLVTPSRSLASRLEDVFGHTSTVVPNRVVVADDVQGLPWTKPVIFYVGRLEPGKNVEEALEITARVRKHVDAHLLVMTPTTDRSSFIAHASKLGLEAHLSLRGSVPFHQTSAYYAGLSRNPSLFVSCSLHETWGLAAAEAFAHRIPAVLTDNPGHSEVVQGDPNFLYAGGHVDAAAALAVEHLSGKSSTSLPRLSDFHRNLSDVTDALLHVV